MNGVVRTLSNVAACLERGGDVVEVIGPDRFRTVPLPSYSEIRLSLLPERRLAVLVDDFQPSVIHIATEGPLGWAMRRICLRRRWLFTTSFHTKFPDYLQARTGLPPRLAWAVLRRFHAAADRTFAATRSLEAEVARRGFRNIGAWTRGVDLGQFRTAPRDAWGDLPGPVSLYVSRVAVEKNIEAFLKLDLPGTKVVVGDGPQRAELERRYPGVHFVGWLQGEALSRAYAGGDVFVFPSLTDTFGLVLLEAMACGTPVAAYPVTGSLDVVVQGTGALNWDLRQAVLDALTCSRDACRRHAETFSWEDCTRSFRKQLVLLDPVTATKAA